MSTRDGDIKPVEELHEFKLSERDMLLTGIFYGLGRLLRKCEYLEALSWRMKNNART